MNLQQLRFLDVADVYKAGVHAGQLVRDDQGQVEFVYAAEYAGPAVATTLPLSEGRFKEPGGGVPPFFAGLLPEGHRLTVLRNSLKSSADDEFTFLLAIGRDTPGDVQIVPAGQILQDAEPVIGENMEDLDFAELTQTVDAQAIPGFQHKASASMINVPVPIPGGGAILKIDPPQYPHLVRNEAFHLEHARNLGIPVSDASIVYDRHELPGLLVERFDRSVTAKGNLKRYAQEDAAQALNIYPSKKYSVSSEEVVRCLANLSSAPLIATRNLYMQFFYAWLTGNGDLHAKNLSVTATEAGTWNISPMYDLPSTLFYGDNSMALPIAGRTRNLRLRHWEEFADSIALPQSAASRVREEVAGVVSHIDLTALPFKGSILYGAERELRFRRAQL